MLIRKLFAVLVTLFVFSAIALGQEQLPKPQGFVNDFAHVLSPEQVTALNDELITFNKGELAQIAVITVVSLGDKTVDQYAKQLGDLWGVGHKGKDDGIVLLHAPKERKVCIAMAPGASLLSTARANQIRDQVILPKFRAGDLAGGLIDGTHAIIAVFAAKPVAVEEPLVAQQTVVSSESASPWTVVLIVAVVVAVIGGLFVFLLVRDRELRKLAVFDDRSRVEKLIVHLKALSFDEGVCDATRARIRQLDKDFLSLAGLSPDYDRMSWQEIQEALYPLEADLSVLEREVLEEIEAGETARTAGPNLMAAMPQVLKEAKAHLATGMSSPKAEELFDKAQAQYDKAVSQQEEMSVTDWFILYSLLVDSHRYCQDANDAHWQYNQPATPATYRHSSFGGSSPHNPSPASPISDDNSSSSGGYNPLDTSGPGFGDTGGFGGGGGFDAGGSSSGGY